jgi:hypothetical protein
LIFAVNLLFVLIGMIYFLFLRIFGRRDIIFDLAFLLITVFFAWRTELSRRFADHLVNQEFKGLLLGIVIILGAGILAVPLLYRSRLMDKYVF